MLRKPAVVMAAVCAAAAATLVAPSGAFACTSATCVYTPQNVGAGGSKSGNSTTQTPTHVSKNVISKVSRAGKDAAALKGIVSNPNLGMGKDRHLSATGPVASPSAFGAIFDLGTGPLALIAILVGSAVLVLAAIGWRGWRRWRGGRLVA